MSNQMEDAAREVGAVPLKDVLNLLNGAFYVLDQGGHFVLWNQRVERITGLAPRTLRRIHMLDLFPPEERAMVASATCNVLANGEQVELHAHLLVGGRRIPYLFLGSCLVVGQHRYVLGNAVDLSRPTLQRQALNLRERALHAASNGIVITRCAGKDNLIEYVNPAFERITGFALDDILGQDAGFMRAGDLDLDQREQLNTAIAERRAAAVVIRNQRKNGELFWNHLAINPVRDNAGDTTHFVGILEDITELKQRTAQLEHQVTHDALTGVANRTLLRDRLSQAIQAARRSGNRVALVLLDLNGFKQINDTLGHDVGDQVLVGVAQRLQAALRNTDTVARLGGDEFVLVLSEQPSLRFTLGMIARVRQALDEEMHAGQTTLSVGASMGVALWPTDGDEGGSLLCAADAAMYQGKKGGQSAVHFYSPTMAASAEAREHLDKALHAAMERHEFFLLYQPCVNIDSGRPLGVEALLRWRHPQLGDLLPGAFLEDAEQNGLIIPLGRQVLAQVCRLIAHLDQLGLEPLPVSINTSRRELHQHDYLPHIADCLKLHRIDPSRIVLELREADLIHDMERIRRFSARVHDMGMHLWLDHFGSGASDLCGLRTAGIDQLKISHSTVGEICPDGQRGAMAKIMLDIGMNLDIKVAATGVETLAQRDFLAAHGCGGIQGNFIAAPLPQHALEQWLRQATGAGMA